MTNVPRHQWVRGGLRRDRAGIVDALGLPDLLAPTIDAHRRLRGPYTAAGTLVRALAPSLIRRPDLVRRYDVEVLSVAPELSAVVPDSRQTLTSMVIPAERTRFYARLRTQRISHGVVELVRDGLEDDGPCALVVENVEHAEVTDLEFLAIALRRIDPRRLTVVLCSGDGEVAEPLRSALAQHAEVVVADPTAQSHRPNPLDDVGKRARRYVESDGTSDAPELLSAYEALDDAARAELHEWRAAQLRARDEQSLGLGALPYHLVRGHDAAGVGVRALHEATDYCVCSGFYTAAVELGQQGLAVVDPVHESTLWWRFTTAVGLSLSILSRTKEAQQLYEEARLHSILPRVHMAAGYSIAMLYTRHNDPQDRDERKAKAWLNSSIATASLVEDPSERAFLGAFYRNGLALVEVNLGDPSEALLLVNGCIESLERLLTPDEHRLHRTVLKNNRARVYAMLGRLDEALEDYAAVIAADPNHAEHYLERGNILRRAGRDDAAAADYDRAVQLSPPFAEIYYNRADLRLSRSDRKGALEDFSYVLELDPECVDAYINRAGLYLEDSELDAARQDAVAGLRREPENPHLHVVLGEVEGELGRPGPAQRAFDRALEADPDLVPALAGRAALAWQAGDEERALRHLGRAVELAPEDPALRFNRATIHQEAGRWTDALADLKIAAEVAADDPDVAAALETCRAAVEDAGRLLGPELPR